MARKHTVVETVEDTLSSQKWYGVPAPDPFPESPDSVPSIPPPPPCAGPETSLPHSLNFPPYWFQGGWVDRSKP